MDTVGECSSGAIALCSPLVRQAGPAILDVFTSTRDRQRIIVSRSMDDHTSAPLKLDDFLICCLLFS